MLMKKFGSKRHYLVLSFLGRIRLLNFFYFVQNCLRNIFRFSPGYLGTVSETKYNAQTSEKIL